jgi:hypothetical protein
VRITDLPFRSLPRCSPHSATCPVSTATRCPSATLPRSVLAVVAPAASIPEPAPVTPEESAFRSRREANARRTVKRAERRAAAPGGTVALDSPVCATCDTRAESADNFCAECGSPFGEPAPVSIAPVTTPYALAAYSAMNQARILTQCPAASDVRGFHA